MALSVPLRQFIVVGSGIYYRYILITNFQVLLNTNVLIVVISACSMFFNTHFVCIMRILILYSNVILTIHAMRMNLFSNKCASRPVSSDFQYEYATVKVRNQIECVAQCQRDEACSAVTFDKTTQNCSLFSDVEKPCVSSGGPSGMPEKYVEKVNQLTL